MHSLRREESRFLLSESTASTHIFRPLKALYSPALQCWSMVGTGRYVYFYSNDVGGCGERFILPMLFYTKLNDRPVRCEDTKGLSRQACNCRLLLLFVNYIVCRSFNCL